LPGYDVSAIKPNVRHASYALASLVILVAAACGDDSPAPADAPPAAADAAVIPDAQVADAGAEPDADDSVPGLPACGQPLPCPLASGTTTTVCGQLYDLESDDPIGATQGAATRCDPTQVTESGPCSFKPVLYDALGFSMGSPTQLGYAPDDLVYDSCGRFRVTGLTPGGSGITAVAARGEVTSGILVRMVAGGTYADQRLYTVTRATNTTWSEQLGRKDLRSNGVYVSIHVVPPTFAPVAGVTLTGTAGGNSANFYFDDTDPRQRSSLGPTTQDATGPNGTAILLDQPTLGTFTSSGGTLPEGCNWNTIQGGNIPGVYLIQRRVPFEGLSTEVCSP
jgi:hypothetical protein